MTPLEAGAGDTVFAAAAEVVPAAALASQFLASPMNAVTSCEVDELDRPPRAARVVSSFGTTKARIADPDWLLMPNLEVSKRSSPAGPPSTCWAWASEIPWAFAASPAIQDCATAPSPALLNLSMKPASPPVSLLVM